MGARDLEERAREALGLAAAHARETRRAADYADEAVILAEELDDDPVLLADALAARLRTHSGPDELDARLGTSLRLLALVRNVPEPDVRLQAHLWRLTTAMEQLDLGAVRRQLAALDLLADETHDERSRFYACSRRAMFALTEGDTVGAARLAAEAAEASTGEVRSADAILRTLRAELARQRGERTALVQHATACEELGHTHDGASLLAQAAVLWLESGEPDQARRLVDVLVPSIGELPRDGDWLLVVCKLAEAAAGSGRSGTAARCADLAEPYAGRGVLDSRAAVFSGVVDDYLALASGDRDQAARARAAYRRLGADWWAGRGPLGRAHEHAAGASGPRIPHLHPTETEGPTRLWCVGREGSTRLVPALPGLEYLRLLIEQPGSEVPVAGEGSEQARSAIRRAMRTALARLELHDGEVARELRTTIRTGPAYRYEPDLFRPVEWCLESHHAAERVGEP